MRELSFSQLWPKLAQHRFTTFRFTRKDRDWQVGETVKVVFKARSPKDRSVLGLAVITANVPRWVYAHRYLRNIKPELDYSLAKQITEQEARADGFPNRWAMVEYMRAAYKARLWKEPMNKLTLTWTQYWLYVPEQKELIQPIWAAMLGKDLFTEVLNYVRIPGTKTAKYILHQAELERIHDQVALGSMKL